MEALHICKSGLLFTQSHSSSHMATELKPFLILHQDLAFIHAAHNHFFVFVFNFCACHVEKVSRNGVQNTMLTTM